MSASPPLAPFPASPPPAVRRPLPCPAPDVKACKAGRRSSRRVRRSARCEQPDTHGASRARSSAPPLSTRTHAAPQRLLTFSGPRSSRLRAWDTAVPPACIQRGPGYGGRARAGKRAGKRVRRAGAPAARVRALAVPWVVAACRCRARPLRGWWSISTELAPAGPWRGGLLMSDDRLSPSLPCARPSSLPGAGSAAPRAGAREGRSSGSGRGGGGGGGGRRGHSAQGQPARPRGRRTRRPAPVTLPPAASPRSTRTSSKCQSSKKVHEHNVFVQGPTCGPGFPAARLRAGACAGAGAMPWIQSELLPSTLAPDRVGTLGRRRRRLVLGAAEGEEGRSPSPVGALPLDRSVVGCEPAAADPLEQLEQLGQLRPLWDRTASLGSQRPHTSAGTPRARRGCRRTPRASLPIPALSRAHSAHVITARFAGSTLARAAAPGSAPGSQPTPAHGRGSAARHALDRSWANAHIAGPPGRDWRIRWRRGRGRRCWQRRH